MARILWLTENYPPRRGGMAESCDRIVRGLSEAGLIIDVVHLRKAPGDWNVTKRQGGGRLFSCPVAADASHTLNRLWNVLEAENPRAGWDRIVLFGGILPMMAGPIFAAYLKIPLVCLFRGNDFDAAVFDLKRRAVLRECIEASAEICCVTREQERKLHALFPAANLRYIPNGISLDNWEALPDDTERARRLTGGDSKKLTLGVFGQIKAKKGILFFIKALLGGRLTDRFRLLLVGEWDEQLAAVLNDHPELETLSFEFVDRYSLIPYYLACDFVVLPSFYDGLPNVLLEAGALGRPFIAARTGGMADVLQPGRHGLLFRPGDGPACRQALVDALRITTDEREAMGRALAEHVRGEFPAALETERYLELFQTNRTRNPQGEAL